LTWLIHSADNHKPPHTSATRRTTTLASPSSTNLYNLRLEDTNDAGDKDIFTFTGQKSALKKSYVLVFDPSNQQATLEPLSSSYTFNLATKNGKDVSSQHTKIYPKKLKDNAQDKDDDDDLFGEAAADDEAGDPDPDNPYDFRHFLSKEKDKRGDESEYHFASSPDYRTGTGSAVNTPQFGARASAAVAPIQKAAAPVPKKRRTAAANPMVSKPKKPQATPAVRLQRTATDTAPKSKSKAAAPPASKIKSAELVHSSDESDGEAVLSPPIRHSPLPEPRQQYHDEDEDAEGESDDDGVLEIEVPDARPPRRNHGALGSLGLGQNIGTGYLRSPSNGPISLASAANSDVEGSPNPHVRGSRNTQDEIDFGDLGREDAEGEGEDEDYNNRDIEPMDIGPPARQDTTANDRKTSTAGAEAEEDDEDDLEELMRRGLEGGDSSEESEEE
jgi:hypothetical protein